MVHEANKEEGEENKLSNKWIQVDMSWLRYKDLDLLEGIFKLWTAQGREAMSVKKAFEVRLRQLLQARIENKVNFFAQWNVSIPGFDSWERSIPGKVRFLGKFDSWERLIPVNV